MSLSRGDENSSLLFILALSRHILFSWSENLSHITDGAGRRVWAVHIIPLCVLIQVCVYTQPDLSPQ